jgi:hypothetical protein
MPYKCKKINKKLSLNSGIQTNQILTNDDEVCIPRLSSILLAVFWKIEDTNTFFLNFLTFSFVYFFSFPSRKLRFTTPTRCTRCTTSCNFFFIQICNLKLFSNFSCSFSNLNYRGSSANAT